MQVYQWNRVESTKTNKNLTYDVVTLQISEGKKDCSIKYVELKSWLSTCVCVRIYLDCYTILYIKCLQVK